MSFMPNPTEQLRIENYRLKQELAQLTGMTATNSSYLQSGGVVKRPHYYIMNSQQPLIEQERRIQELEAIVAKNNSLINSYQSHILGIERHFNNILKIDQDIYKKLEPVSPNVRNLEDAKNAVKRG